MSVVTVREDLYVARMSKRMLTTLCHVASQLLYRWNPGPQYPDSRGDYSSCSGGDLDSCEYSDLTQVTGSDWAVLVDQLVRDGCEEAPWLHNYFKKSDPSGEILLQSTVRHLRLVAQTGAKYITILDPLYPSALRSLRDPPLGLSLRGNVELLRLPMVSVIGSRKGSGLAIQESFRLGALLSKRGIVTVSGGAFGCDIAAHHGVLSHGSDQAFAIGVFAGGLARLYPRGNSGVFRRLEERGGVFVSERLWWTSAQRFDFPIRNRLISGLSGVTFVMQAGQPSGAYLTAKMALEQGRDVAVLTHPPQDVRAQGSRDLIGDGAREFSQVQEFVDSIEVVGQSLAGNTGDK